MTIEKEIQEAYQFLRKENNTISSETIEFMRAAALLLATEGAVRRDGAGLQRCGIGGLAVCVGFTNANALEGKCATVIIIPGEHG